MEAGEELRAAEPLPADGLLTVVRAAEPMPADGLLAVLRAAGEPTRLRILALLAEGERSVKDLTDILGQSQPRISRHLKLLTEAGLAHRHREGAWAFFRLAEEGPAGEIVRDLVARLDRDDATLARDRERLELVRKAHADAATRYFREHAAEWDSIRSLHVPEAAIEAAMLGLLGEERFDTVVDLGTGTGRILELLADRAERGIGVDISPDMLSYARSKLEQAGLTHCQVRQGDVYNPPIAAGRADVVTMHQVLHALDDPARAIEESARLLAPGGCLLVVDLAPHELEFLRSEHAHRRLGFTRSQVAAWMRGAGAPLVKHLEIPPEGSGAAGVDQLTVSAWLGRRRQAR